MNFVKKTVAVSIFFLIAAFGAPFSEIHAEDSIASVNGVPVSRADYDREMKGIEQQLLRQGINPTDEQLNNLEKTAVKNLIERELLLQAAAALGLSVDDEAVSAYMANIKGRFKTEEEFQDAVKKLGLTEEQVVEQYKQKTLIQMFIEKEIYKNVRITEEDAKEFYDKNPEKFKQPEQVRARHILIKFSPDAGDEEKKKARERIEEVAVALKKEGSNFADLATRHSDCPSASKGGDLGFFKRGQMVEPFEEVAFKLEPGRISDVVETKYGYHLIKVEEKRPAGKVEFNVVKGRLADYLRRNKAQEELARYLEEAKKKAKIEIFLEEAK